MIIDDEADLRLLISASLMDSGHESIPVGDPRRALEMAAEDPPDAFILDVMMPNLTGWEVLKALRSMPAVVSKPILMLSAIGDAKARAKGIRLGADDFLAKPFDLEELLVRLESLLSKHRDGPSSLRGSLESHALSEIAQTLQHLSSEGRLEVVGSRVSGWIETAGEVLIDAQFGSLRGDEAFLAMLELKEGEFAFSPAPPDKEKPSEASGSRISRLLLEGAWIEDEISARGALVPALGSQLVLLQAPEEAPQDLPRLPLDEIAALLAGGGGKNTGTLISEVARAPQRTLLALTWLLEKGWLAAFSAADGLALEGLAPIQPASSESSSEHESSARVGQEEGEGKPPVVSPEELEAVEAALRELLQVATFEGLSLEPFRVAFLIEAEVWSGLGGFLESVSAAFSGSLSQADMARILQERRGEVALSSEAARLALSFELWPQEAEQTPPRVRPWGVVAAWSAETNIDSTRDSFLSSFASKLPSRAGKLVFRRGGEEGKTAGGWNQVAAPTNFRECLVSLTRAWD